MHAYMRSNGCYSLEGAPQPALKSGTMMRERSCNAIAELSGASPSPPESGEKGGLSTTAGARRKRARPSAAFGVFSTFPLLSTPSKATFGAAGRLRVGAMAAVTVMTVGGIFWSEHILESATDTPSRPVHMLLRGSSTTRSLVSRPLREPIHRRAQTHTHALAYVPSVAALSGDTDDARAYVPSVAALTGDGGGKGAEGRGESRGSEGVERGRARLAAWMVKGVVHTRDHSKRRADYGDTHTVGGGAAGVHTAHVDKGPLTRPVRPIMGIPQEAVQAKLAYEGPPDFEALYSQPPLRPMTVMFNHTSTQGFPMDKPVAIKVKDLLAMSKQEGQAGRYATDFREAMSFLSADYSEQTIIVRFGDSTATWPYPYFTKARVIGDANAIVFPLNYVRHFGQGFQSLFRGQGDTLSFSQKRPTVFWRGESTNTGWDPVEPAPLNQRRALMERWGNFTDTTMVDVGFSALVQKPKRMFSKTWEPYVKGWAPISRQLMHRYLISVEGNDVASGLKWMLASNSVVMMPPPRKESWVLEGQLKPWVHYVPLAADFSDLLDRVSLCEANLDFCADIARRATEYVRWFASSKRSYRAAARRAMEFFERVEVTHPPEGTVLEAARVTYRDGLAVS